ncbi:MAG: hypothetical protein GY679_04370, partial [Mycoplasma sp.]|nr:hypothetical protein [Mycoplasma sp.]
MRFIRQERGAEMQQTSYIPFVPQWEDRRMLKIDAQSSLMINGIEGDPNLVYPHFYNRSRIRALELWARQNFATQIMMERDPLREEKLTEAMHDPTAAATFQFECNFTSNFRAQETMGVAKRRSQ